MEAQVALEGTGYMVHGTGRAAAVEAQAALEGTGYMVHGTGRATAVEAQAVAARLEAWAVGATTRPIGETG